MVDTLNDHQLAAARATSNAFVEAAPGSGKTRLAAAKVQREIRRAIKDGREVLCLTFTQAAKEQIDARVGAALSSAEYQHVVIRTLHGFCLSELVRPFGAIICGRRLRLAAPDSNHLRDSITRVADRTGLDSVALEKATKNAWRDEAGKPRSASGYSRIIASAINEVWDDLLLNGFVDHTSVIYQSLRLVRDNASVLDSLVARFAWILVDEYQDTDLTQLELLREFSRSSELRLFLLGDLQQSIYSFRGCDVASLEKFPMDIEASRYHLPETYRCGQRICDAAMRLHPRRMEAAGKSAEIVAETSAFRHDLKTFIVHDFLARCAALKIPDNEILIVSSRRDILSTISPYVREAGRSIVLTPRKEDLTWFQVLFDPFLAALRATEIGDVSKAGDAMIEFLDASDALPGGANIQKTIRESMEDTVLRFPDVVKNDMPVRHQMSAIVDLFFTALANSGVLRSNVFDTLRETVEVTWLQLSESGLYSESVTAVAERVRPKQSVRAMTIHNAKGLEFDAVAILDVTAGTLPGRRAEYSAAEFEEDVRKFYVAVTRARRLLHIQVDPLQRHSPFVDVLAHKIEIGDVRRVLRRIL